LLQDTKTPAGNARHAAQFLALLAFRLGQLGVGSDPEVKSDLHTANRYVWRIITDLEAHGRK